MPVRASTASSSTENLDMKRENMHAKVKEGI